MSVDWDRVADCLDNYAAAPSWHLDQPESTDTFEPGQRAALMALADRIRGGRRAVLLADEVGMGKTLIAAALMRCVQMAGGRSVVVLPPGLGSQWRKELGRLNEADRALPALRSFWTFIESFGWRAESEAERLADRRLDREWPRNGWAAEPIVLLSHNLAAVRRTEKTIPWYDGLGEAALKILDGRRRYFGSDHSKASRKVAETILAPLVAREKRGFERQLRGTPELADRSWLTMGRGLGKFDLVVIDEAHKARGRDTSLTRILDRIIWKDDDAFHLGMTATPVELGAWQWRDTLGRLSVEQAVLDDLSEVIDRYVTVVDQLQHREALTEELVDRFSTIAGEFQQRLSPWVLRRDKREDRFLSSFTDRHGSHRDLSPVQVSLADMSIEWKRAFIASEALSLLSDHDLGEAERRLRLSLPDGRGLVEIDAAVDAAGELTEIDSRTSPWLALATAVTAGGNAALVAHPAIGRAVAEIESSVFGSDKVLVFGRYVRPMRALTALLDAREMVRRLCREDTVENRWPQSTIAGYDPLRRAALEAALADPAVNSAGLSPDSVEEQLAARARRHANARRASLETARAGVERLADVDAQALLTAWATEGPSDTSALLSALEELRPAEEQHQPWTATSLVEAFRNLRAEVRRGDDDDDPQGFQDRLAGYLSDFKGRDAHFARLMYGATSAQTRRLLQAAFNREGSWPAVLVTQSTVGREGLNLQFACRTVVMLHLEWNPAHAEQQIGRVDRIASLWARQAEAHMTSGEGDAPRIRVRPIIVTGTYDDYHWAVLSQRWNSMKAQLNGDILPGIVNDDADPARASLVARARAAAPDFSPRPIVRN